MIKVCQMVIGEHTCYDHPPPLHPSVMIAVAAKFWDS